jgi:hypothetical protein
MRVGEVHPSTMEHIKMMNHYARLRAETRIIDTLRENDRREETRRVQEANKGQHVDVMV